MLVGIFPYISYGDHCCHMSYSIIMERWKSRYFPLYLCRGKMLAQSPEKAVGGFLCGSADIIQSILLNPWCITWTSHRRERIPLDLGQSFIEMCPTISSRGRRGSRITSAGFVPIVQNYLHGRQLYNWHTTQGRG